MRLARIGLEDTQGYLKGGIDAWRNAGLPLAELPQISVDVLNLRLQDEDLQVLDVRREREWEEGHIEGASWWPLDNFKVAPPEIDRTVPIAVHCKGGYRSMIACSLLQRAGFQNVINVVGGFDAWQACQTSHRSRKAGPRLALRHAMSNSQCKLLVRLI